MTNGREYRLGDKMQNQFRNRGSEVSGMRASSTSELMRRAEMGSDPRVNCAEQAFRESYSKRPSSNTGAYSQTKRTQSRAYGTRTGAGSSSGAGSRSNAYSSAGNRTDRKYGETVQEPITPTVEIKVKHKMLSPLFLALLVVGTLMVMCLVFSISEVYKSTNEIARLENQLEALQDEADELRLRLEEKNDVRTIEEIATTELGMVKEDSLQRRYVSLSDGEYIELVANEAEADESTGGVMLSSIFASLGKFFERFK